MMSSSDVAVFVRTVDLRTFAAAGSEFGITASGASRIVSRLEKQLGVRLLHRSTRKLVLSHDGEAFLPHARAILAAVEQAESALSRSRGKPSGIVRINTGTALARRRLTTLLPEFMTRYPEITIELSITDRRVDPIAERIDVTLRVGPLLDSELVSTRLGEVRRVIAASPNYLKKNGKPRLPADLANHNCLMLSGFPRLADWPMNFDGRRMTVPVTGNFMCDSAEMLLDLAIAGVGIIRFGDFLGNSAVADGRLVTLLQNYHDDDPQPITALVLPGRQDVPRVRLLLDFLKRRFVTEQRR